MKISVIVPVYNTEPYLNRCIDSILAQTMPDFEVLLIDDGSTDQSGRICDDYAEKDNRVRVFHKANGGVSRARNLGIENARGEYLSFIDSDDYICPEMYETLLRCAEKNQVDLVISDMEQNGKKMENGILPEQVLGRQEIQNAILPYFSRAGMVGAGAYTTMLIKKSVVEQNRIRFYEDFAFQEDTMFVINLYGNISTLYYLPKVFYEYTTHPTGLYSAYRRGDGINFIKAREIMEGLIKQYEIQIDQLQFDLTFLYNITWFIFRTLRLKDQKEKRALIDAVLLDEKTREVCIKLKDTASSFDRRIAKAICKKKKRKAIFLIKFVHSGKAAKLQKLIGKIKRRG